MIKQYLFLTAGLSFLLLSCGVRPKGSFSTARTPAPPDYSENLYWAALPDRTDLADSLPPGTEDRQDEAAIDVFFLHPTTYTGKKGDRLWNGPVDDPELNERTDERPILYQATIFNGAGRIYAPRYRQAHLHAYFTKKREEDARQAFKLAYQDVEAAFEYYLQHYNQGRPVMIAAHSQGTTHGKRLLLDFFDGKELQDQLVAAYLVGIPVEDTLFQNIPPCETPEQTGCFISWRTFKYGHFPKKYEAGNNILATNPLLWTTEPDYAPKELNKGAILRDFQRIFPELADAQVHDGLLWIHKPKFPGSFLLFNPNYHIGDYNLFYLNVRENAMLRVRMFQESNGEKGGY